MKYVPSLEFIRFATIPTMGAILGWLIAEPWSEDYGYFRDWFLFFALALGISIAVVLEQSIFYRKWGVSWSILKNRFLYIIPVVGALFTKLIFTDFFAPETINCGKDTSRNDVVFLLDVSGSMRGRPIDELQKALENYIDLLQCSESQDRVSIIVFESEASMVLNLSDNYEHAHSVLSDIYANGGTNLTAGLEKAYRNINGSSTNQGYIVLVSDGVPDNKDEVLRFLKSNDVVAPVYTIGAGSDYDRQLLEYIAELTNGKFYPSNNITDLSGVFREVVEMKNGITQVANEKERGIPIFKRVLGWVLLGLFIGITIGNVDLRPNMLPIGIIGGVLGGALSVAIFEIVNMIGIESGSYLRMTTFGIFGLCIGLAVFITMILYNKLKGGSRGRFDDFFK